LKEKGTYKSIEELYREMLHENEHPVPGNLWSDFVPKLRLREFLHFRPGSFNIYYLAGIIAAAAMAISLLAAGNSKQDPGQPGADLIINDIFLPDTIENNIAKDTPDARPAGNSEIKNTVDINNNIDPVGPLTKKTETGTGTATPNQRLRTIGSIKTLDVNSKFSYEPVIRPAAVANFKTGATEGCVPLSVYFKNLSHNYDSCIWEFDDGGISTEENPVWVFDEEGIYEVKLILFGKDGSRAVKSQRISVYSPPVARFEISAGNPHIPDEQIHFYNYSQNAVNWEWDFGDGNKSSEFEPSHFYDKQGSYTVKLKAISEYGCVDSMILTDAFEDNSCYIKFPNAFIPNQGGPTGGYYSKRTDQQEEVFHPVWSGVISYKLSIYSRKGMLIFESVDIETGWDGYYRGQKAEPGVYIWKVRGLFKNGEAFIKGGDLTLMTKW